MRTILLLFVMLCGFITNQAEAQSDSLFNYKKSHLEKTVKFGSKPRAVACWGIRITPKFESDPCVGKRVAVFKDVYKHPDYVGNVDSTYQAFFSVPKWKAKLKKMQEVDKTLNVSMYFHVNPSGEILYSYLHLFSREKCINVADWFTEEELLELYLVSKKIRYNLAVLDVEYTCFMGDKIVDYDYANKKYDYVNMSIRSDDIREKLIKAGVY